MGFTDAQTKKLVAKLNADHVRTRAQDGFALSYIEGWHAISEANRVFGFDGWDRETLSVNCVWVHDTGNQCSCSYIVQVRLKVRAGDQIVFREASGSSTGQGRDPGSAHEQAVKQAEIDATSRALATFGNTFGLALYDIDGKDVLGDIPTPTDNSVKWVILESREIDNAIYTDPMAFCSAMRKTMEGYKNRNGLIEFWNQNRHTVDTLRRHLPDLKEESGRHYGECLESLYCFRRQELSQDRKKKKKKEGQPKADQKNAQSNEKAMKPRTASVSLKRGPKRIRDKVHLKFVGSQSCLICGRKPSQAHHLKDAQVRAMGRKVSDEFTVPLCAIHHRQLHDRGNEKIWWELHKIEPMEIAHNLWIGNTIAETSSED
jgi:DNA recombination protein Rad52